MRVVLDTNVLVSAAMSEEGASAEILRAWRSGLFQLVTSSPMLAEYERVLRYPRIVRRLAWTAQEVTEMLHALSEHSLLMHPNEPLAVVAADPADDRFLEAAVAGEAEFIVSRDEHLLGVGRYRQVEIVAPARFLAILSV